jgi:hypothetical protein
MVAKERLNGRTDLKALSASELITEVHRLRRIRAELNRKINAKDAVIDRLETRVTERFIDRLETRVTERMLKVTEKVWMERYGKS